jgi:hypothetical protein
MAVTTILLGFYIYMIARPVSYGMEYNNLYEYAGVQFKGILIKNKKRK